MAKGKIIKKIFEGIGRRSRKMQGKKAKIKEHGGKKGSPYYKTTPKGQHKSIKKKTTKRYDTRVGTTRAKQGAAVAGGAAVVGLGSQVGKDKPAIPAQQPKVPSGFGAAFRKARNDYLNDRSKKKTFEWEGNQYHVRIKGETPAMLKTQRDKTLSGAFKKGAKTTTTKTTKRKTFKQRRLERLKKRQARVAKRKNPLIKGRADKLKKRISRLEKKADGGLAKKLGLRNRPEKRLVRAMKPGAGKQLEEAVMRSRVAKNKKNMDLPPRRRQGVSIKGYKRGDLVQGYDDRLHESLGARHPGKKTQSLKSRSDESKGAEKAAGKRAYASVTTMDKGTRKAKPRGVGVAKRGYGKALK